METRRSLEDSLVLTQAAKEAVLYANTATYLYERLRKDTSVSYVGKQLQTEEIIESLQKSSTEGIEKALDLVRFYVLLVSLCQKDDLKQFRNQILQMHLSKIQWAEQIRDLILSEQVPTTVSAINVRTVSRLTSDSGNASGSIILTDREV